MPIGLIGGIGPAATDFYYRRLIAAFAARASALDLTIVHADSPTLLPHPAADDRDAQVAIYTRLTARLVAARAECVVVTSIAGHFCIGEFAAVSPRRVTGALVDLAGRPRTARRVKCSSPHITARLTPAGPARSPLWDARTGNFARPASVAVPPASPASYQSLGGELSWSARRCQIPTRHW